MATNYPDKLCERTPAKHRQTAAPTQVTTFCLPLPKCRDFWYKSNEIPQHVAATLLIHPFLTDYHETHAALIDLDFAVPFLEEDILLYLDPFMLRRLPSQQDQALYAG